MAKLVAIAALFLAVIAGASAYTTVVTTTVMDEENPQQSCQGEMQQVSQMTHCMQYMQSSSPFLRSAVANQQFEHLEGCCAEVRKFSRECRCEAIREMMMQVMQQYGMEAQMMMQKGQYLPMMCRMRSPRMCHFTSTA